MNNLILDDLYRITGTRNKRDLIKKRKYDYGFSYLYFWRSVKQSKGLKKKIYKYLLLRVQKNTGIEIPLTVELGAGARLIHPFSITINSKAKIGKNSVFLKGSTVGNQKRGKRNGAPVIGDDFYLGLNATVVGNVKIGNDVMIAANSFVNFDVPSHSIVIGNPGKIYSRKYATEKYIENRV